MSRNESIPATVPPHLGSSLVPMLQGGAQVLSDLYAVHMNCAQRMALVHRSAIDEMGRSQSLMEVLSIQATMQRALFTDWLKYGADLARALMVRPPGAAAAGAPDTARAVASEAMAPVVSAMAEPALETWQAIALQPFALQGAAAFSPPSAAAARPMATSDDRPQGRAQPTKRSAGRPSAAATPGTRKKPPARRRS